MEKKMFMKNPVRSVLRMMIPMLGAAIIASSQIPGPKRSPDADKDRGQVLTELAGAEDAQRKNPDDSAAGFRFATLLFQSGDFERARAAAKTLLDAPRPSNEALFLWADLTYILGEYDQAEIALRRIVDLNPKDASVRAKAEAKLVFVVYQTNQYGRAAGLFKGMEGKIKLPHWDLMKAFGADKPYRVNWPAGRTETQIPFAITDPLPIVEVEIEGRKIHALIDTGADTFVLDNDTAAALGIRTVAAMTGTFAGGKQAEVGFARVKTLKAGDVMIESVPVSILPTRRFSSGFAGGHYIIEGIVGTGLLKQFLATLDYPADRLVLRSPRQDSRRIFLQPPAGKVAVEVPFALASTHFLIARGRLNDRSPLTFFVDSGLASEAAFSAPIQTLKYAGIPVPPTKIDPQNIGGGGGAGFATGLFPVRTLGLGILIQENLKGEYGIDPPESYWRLGFIIDGVVSHRFLRRYAWTIDFVRMRMIFVG